MCSGTIVATQQARFRVFHPTMKPLLLRQEQAHAGNTGDGSDGNDEVD